MNRRRSLSMRLALLPALLLCAAASLPAAAQSAGQTTVIQAENVRMDYAQVLRVEPVFQTLRGTRLEQQCDGKPVPPQSPPKGLSRIVGAVKQALNSADTDTPSRSTTEGDCRTVSVEREFRRPIAFDVDYIYKGMKYRSRLPNDPGNRLRIRVSVAPYVTPPGER
ncbi:MAG TPA: hypothetical protein VHF02_10865 [Luteimonas sp.]|nr:hypothetical protein [Luteimonas sp.]